MNKRVQNILGIAVIITSLLASLPGAQVYAAGLTVTNLNDSGPGSLRQAIADAGAGDTVDFSVTGTIILTSGELLVDKDLTIIGPGEQLLTLDGNQNSRIFHVTATTVSISGMTLTNGRVDEVNYPPDGDNGGAIMNNSDLTLDHVHITNNTVTSTTCQNNGCANIGGGGIYSFGNLSIDHSLIDFNSGYFAGGGIYFAGNSGSQFSIENTTIAHNQTLSPLWPNVSPNGGGIATRNDSTNTFENIVLSNNSSYTGGGAFVGGPTSLRNSSILSNTAEGNGGGIINFGTLELKGSIFTGNTAFQGGAIYNTTTTAIFQTSFENSYAAYGGALYNQGGTAVAVASVFNGNQANITGGAVESGGGTLGLVNDTFTNNSAVQYTGGALNLVSGATAILYNDTFSGNSIIANSPHFGSSIYQDVSGSLTIKNTILANGVNGSDCVSLAALTADSNNLIENNDSVNPCGSPALTVDPQLGPLADNGGPTQTMALLLGSPAIDAGDDATCTDINSTGSKDQRAVSRPQGAHCDIGAVEFGQPYVVSVVRNNASPTNLASVDFTVTFSDIVNGVDTTDFKATTTGLSGASVATVNTVDQISYLVSVDTGKGDGTIRLDLVDDDSIADNSANLLGGGGLVNGDFVGGEVYLIDKPDPADGGHALTLRPVFDWDDVSGATSYFIQIARVNTFSTVFTSGNPLSSTFIPTRNLPVNSTLYWRVRPNTSAIWSDVMSFSTGNPPSIPILRLPKANKASTDYTPLLTWSPSRFPLGTSFLKYQIQLDNDPFFASPEVDTTSTVAYLESPATLLPDTTYYWRVRAFNTAGEYSNWQKKVARFHTAMLPPVLSSPNNGLTLNFARPTLDWADSPATSYRIQVSDTPGFTHLVINKITTLSTYTPTIDLKPNTTYYWRVLVFKPAPAHFAPSLYSTAFSFNTGVYP